MKAKFCLPIITESKKETLKKIELNKSNFDMFELWISRIKDIDNDFIADLIQSFPGRFVLVFRSLNGEVKISKEIRENIIILCNNKNVFVDIDFIGQKEDLKFIKFHELNVRVILSYHNYKETPYNLNEIIENMSKENTNIIKFAAKCKSEIDSLRLLSLLLFCKKRGLKAVILGMGKQGIITRIFGSLWGNEIIFAPENKKDSSAQGQLTRSQLENIFKEMEK